VPHMPFFQSARLNARLFLYTVKYPGAPRAPDFALCASRPMGNAQPWQSHGCAVENRQSTHPSISGTSVLSFTSLGHGIPCEIFPGSLHRNAKGPIVVTKSRMPSTAVHMALEHSLRRFGTFVQHSNRPGLPMFLTFMLFRLCSPLRKGKGGVLSDGYRVGLPEETTRSKSSSGCEHASRRFSLT
jgi:hypothetical protein